ncbi:MAG: alpha-galactosidase [Anaerolineae bacterium]|nr:alpha-galactosidase [Anaerolineae bacterium]
MERADDDTVRLLHFSSLPYADLPARHSGQALIEIQISGENHADHHAKKYTGTMPGTRLRFVDLREIALPDGCRIEIDLTDAATGLFVTYHMQLFDRIPVARVWATLVNRGALPLTLTFVSTFALWGLTRETPAAWAQNAILHIPYHTWCSEAQWRSASLPDLGLTALHEFSLNRVAYASTGSMSSSEFLPMAVLENSASQQTLFWQIEHNGSWYWEMGDKQRELYLRVCGPTEREGHWCKHLLPGQVFETVTVAVGSIQGTIEQAVQALNRYRRQIRRLAPDQRSLPIIFNDYMNCLMGDPTTEKLLPLIEKAGALGCEIFCIDAGWHGDGAWWDSVGEWLPSARRFPNGLVEVTNAIRTQGMIPGLWLEIEVMGQHSALAAQMPDECFFMRHGRRVIDNGRYQLDFRHPQVLAHANRVIDALIRDYGVGYFKVDYNIDAGIGTEVSADSAGDGLLAHNRAYLAWLDDVLRRYPDLIIETCASGGMRMDWALLTRASLQSSSDQMDYRHTARIVAAIGTALPPEQCANWVYPLASDSREGVIFNLVNGMLMRIHLSGQLDRLSDEMVSLVHDGLDFYRQMRASIPDADLIFPLGLPTASSTWLCLGLLSASRAWLAVWRLDSDDEICHIELPFLRGASSHVAAAFPSDALPDIAVEGHQARVRLPEPYSARVFVFEMDAPQDRA